MMRKQSHCVTVLREWRPVYQDTDRKMRLVDSPSPPLKRVTKTPALLVPT